MAREPIAKGLQLKVMYRDRWHCRYCGEAVFFSPTLKLLDKLAPGHGYYDRHGKRGRMLGLLADRCAACDHVVPVASGGPTTPENLLAACFACNTRKSSQSPSEWKTVEPKGEPPSGWDGLAGLYSTLEGADPAWVGIIETVCASHRPSL